MHWIEYAGARLVAHVDWAVRVQRCKRVIVVSNDTDTFALLLHLGSMVIFQGVAIMLPGIAGDAAAVWHPRETAYGSSSFSTGTITHQNSNQGYLLTRDDCMSKMGTKHVSMARDPVKYLNNFGETDTLLEQDTELAKKCLVRVWAGARSTTTCEMFDQFRAESYLT